MKGNRYAGRGNVYSADASAPTVTAHYAKNPDEGWIWRG